MRKTILLILAAVFLGACRAAESTPLAAAQNPQATHPPPTLTAQPTFTKAPPLAPTSTLEIPSPESQPAAPSATPLSPPQDSPANVIQFSAGGTWQDIRDNVAQGKSKTYSLSAMKGQVMSVSLTGGYFPLRIQGADGKTLCPANQNLECEFWRGALPATQDYFITVQSSGGAAEFTLRVAINPPGKAQQLFTYRDPASGLSLSYPDSFAPADPPSSLNNKLTPSLALQWIDSRTYANTNLGEVYGVFGSSNDPQAVLTCAESNLNGGAPEIIIRDVNFGGTDFTYSQSSGAGAGNLYDQHIYRGAEKGWCYEAVFFIHSANIGNYAPGAVKEFDLQALMLQFDSMLNSMETP